MWRKALDEAPEIVNIQRKKIKYQNVRCKIKKVIPTCRDSTILTSYLYILIFAVVSGCGGTGRRAGFRCLWA
jgi:hypothetical protein